MKKIAKFLVFVYLIFYSITTFSQNDSLPAVKLATTFNTDVGRVFSGGISQNNFYLGFIDIGATFHTQGLGLWKHGSLFVSLQNTHGNSLSGEFLGDIQTASNIDNGNFTYLSHICYSQSFSKLSLLFGSAVRTIRSSTMR
ncbi:MAG: hypothetical protein SNJ71_07920 [Bacteroidales bacterium]